MSNANSNINNSLANIIAMSPKSNRPQRTPTNNPYDTRTPPYFERTTLDFIEARGHLANNYWDNMEAENIFGDQQEGEYTKVKMRVVDIIPESSTRIHKVDEWKIIYSIDPRINYIKMGTKFKLHNGNIWLAVNPHNILNITGKAVIRLCTAMYNRLDYYGNVLSEPFVIDVARTSANANKDGQLVIMPRSDFDCEMQYNSKTKNLKENDQMILGGARYDVRGLNNFTREFTNEKDSIRTLTFTLFRMQESGQNDDLENDIIGGKNFSWVITLSATSLKLLQDETGTLQATSLRNRQPPTESYSYIWESSDESIITIDENGNYIGHEIGTATITCTLKENPKIKTTADVEVTPIMIASYEVNFEPQPPEYIKLYKSAVISAYVFNNGIKDTTIPIVFTFGNAATNTYKIDSITNNSVNIWCQASTTKELIVTASATVDGKVYKTQCYIELWGA